MAFTDAYKNLDYIDESTPVSDFPETYNSNIVALQTMVVELQAEVSALKQLLVELKKERNKDYNELYSKFMKMLNTNIEEYENKFIMRDEFEEFKEQIEDKLQ